MSDPNTDADDIVHDPGCSGGFGSVPAWRSFARATYRGNAMHERIAQTGSGEAGAMVPIVRSGFGVSGSNRRFLALTTRASKRFDATIAVTDDRLRGIKRSRTVLLVHRDGVQRQGLHGGNVVTPIGDAGETLRRTVWGVMATPFDFPDACHGGYDPGMNPLIPPVYHDKAARTPASGRVPVRIERIAPIA